MLSPLRATEKDEFFNTRGHGPTTFTFKEHVSHNDKHDDSSTEASTTPKHVPVETSSETSSSTSTKTEVFRGHNSEMGNGIVKIKLGLHLVISSNHAKMKTLTVKKI
jgi:hypothetical protein